MAEEKPDGENPRSDQAKDGCVPVPDGPGLGVTYDWDFIEAHKTQHVVFD